MRICVVSGTFHPEPGGPPTYLSHLLPALIERGHSISVVTYTDEPRSFCDNTTYGYPVWRITRRQPIPLRLLEMTRRIVAVSAPADLLFVSDYGLPAAVANLVRRKPLVIKNVSDFSWEFSTRHGWLPPGQTIDQYQTAVHPVRVRLLQSVQTAYLRAATRIITPSHYIAGLVQGWGLPAERIRVVYNAIDLSPYRGLPARADQRATLGLPADAHFVVAIARLVPWKHFDLVIAALAEVRQRLPTTRLLIVGDGPERARLAAVAAPHGDLVTFVGAVPPSAVPGFLRAADAYVQFSTYEGLPHTVIEALAAGTPVVVSDIGGNLEVITPDENGLVVPAQNVPALAAALHRLLTEPVLAARLTVGGAATLPRFAWPTLVEQTEAVLREATAR